MRSQVLAFNLCYVNVKDTHCIFYFFFLKVHQDFGDYHLVIINQPAVKKIILKKKKKRKEKESDD